MHRGVKSQKFISRTFPLGDLPLLLSGKGRCLLACVSAISMAKNSLGLARVASADSACGVAEAQARTLSAPTVPICALNSANTYEELGKGFY